MLLIALLATAIFSLYRFLSPTKTMKKPHFHSTQTNIILPNLDFEKHLKAPPTHPKPSPQKPPSTPKAALAKATKKRVQIQTQGSDIETLQRAYQRHPSKYMALLIAQRLYDDKNYKKALEWSIKANEFDKSEEKSWIIFAKSAYKLGDKRRAIEALRAYLRRHQSPSIQRLYLQMQKGAFR